MNTEQLDRIRETYECPHCGGEVDDKWCASMNVSWLECQECDFNHVYERG